MSIHSAFYVLSSFSGSLSGCVLILRYVLSLKTKHLEERAQLSKEGAAVGRTAPQHELVGTVPVKIDRGMRWWVATPRGLLVRWFR